MAGNSTRLYQNTIREWNEESFRLGLHNTNSPGATVIVQTEPPTWILYNKLVDMREWTRHKPAGHGYYLPAIELAETLLLNKNATTAGCAVSLLFLSDGKPSDQCKSSTIAQRFGQVASRFGRRLSITCIGMANEDEDFSCSLQSMIDEASQSTFVNQL